MFINLLLLFSKIQYIQYMPYVCSVVDEQNANMDESEPTSPLEFRKDSEEENRDSEKDEDTKELEALARRFFVLRLNTKYISCFFFFLVCLFV